MRSLPEGQGLNSEDESFDPLQLDRYSRLQARAREVNQQLDELGRIERQLSEQTSEISGTLVQQFHLGEQLQDGLISARMVSVNEYLPRFRQLVRETARRAGKSVSFSAQGSDIDVDRQVLDAMVAPFEHMIRNAVVHGIEDSANRGKQGKPEIGQIELEVSQQGSELLIGFSDDGRGLDRNKLGTRAVELGLAAHIDAVTDEQLLQVITEPGFSTAEEVTMESGRGVGMDVVLQAVRSLGGSIGLSSRAGEGTKFNFRLPVTMTISQALLVRVGAYRFAILTRSIERVLRVRYEEIEVIDERDHVNIGDQVLPIVNLADRLGEPSLSTEETYRSIVLIRMPDRVVAFEVDQFDDTVEIVTKTPGRQLTSIAGITGVTVLADTSIVLILNPGEYLDRESLAVVPIQAEDAVATEKTGTSPDILDMDLTGILENVLVVDDSLVVRKVMQRDLEGIGLTVTAAVDGQNALELLEGRNIDVALIDLEMPRMNGYELLVKLRQDDRFSALPIVVVTSRSGEIHRSRAISLGADAYITKPYDIQKLEQIMKSVVREKATVH
jgi:chemosensory pili system protein ChpA (sensor histidine kinase/response regulator)